MPTETPPRRAEPDRRAVVCVALAALVFASRVWLAQAWGSAVPYWDEWDVEAVNLYRPWLAGTLHFLDLFSAHNEHHLLLTRLADLAFFVGFGSWAPWAEMLLNAALHAATAAALAACFWPVLPARARPAFVVGLAVIFTATCGWQNALLGIQSQVYFSNLLSVGALAGLMLAAPWSRAWWAGGAAAVLALFSFGGGVFAALAAAVTLAAAAIFPRPGRGTRIRWGAWAFVVAVAASGLLLFTEPGGQVALHAQSVAQFYAVFARCLGWPHVNSPALWVAMQLPLIVLLAVRWRRGEPLDAAERFALALVVFAIFQAAAVARNRAAGLPDSRPLSRYLDPLLPGAVAQWFIALRLAMAYARTSRLLAIGWAATALIGLLTLTTANLSFNLPAKRVQDTTNLAQIRAYLATHDGTVFTRDSLFPGLHPNPEVVQRVLDDPLLRPVLPEIFFSASAESAPGAKPWLIERGAVLTLLALAGFATAVAWPARRA